MATFTRFKVDRHGRSMYRQNGNKNTTVRFGASFFAGAPPEEIEINSDAMATVGEKKVKLTKEERAALPKPTPTEKLKQAQERAKKAADRAARLEAALAAAGEGGDTSM